jgi:FkbM family methyltransferase
MLHIYNINIPNNVNFNIYLDKNDLAHRDVLAHLSHGQLYEHETSLFFLKVLRAGDVVVDIGANAGYFSLLSSASVGVGGRVVSVEANPASAKLINNSAKLNEFHNIEVMQCAASEATGSVVFNVNGSSDSNGAVVSNKNTKTDLIINDNKKEFIAPSQVFDEIVQEACLEKIKIVKIDTEGHELHVLRGSQRALEKGIVDFFICELNLPGLERNGETSENLLSFMRNYGYYCFLLNNTGGLPTFVPPGVVIEQEYTCNVLFSKPEKIHRYWPAIVNRPASVDIMTRN